MENKFKYLLEQFADIKIMRYRIPGFEELPLKQKELIYYLSQAALCGRDIIFDQNYKHNLTIRRTNEAIIKSFAGNRSNNEFDKFMIYAKRVWFSNGIHHHYSSDKFFPSFDKTFFEHLIKNSNHKLLPIKDNETVDTFSKRILDIIYNTNLDTKKVVLDSGKDIIAESAVNFYENLTQDEVAKFNENIDIPDKQRPVSSGLNSKLVKDGNTIKEYFYKTDGLYGKALTQIIYWLEKAVNVAENEKQKRGLKLLIEFYKTGDLTLWDKYNIEWVQDLESDVDYINGFIETYEDPLGMKATWEAIVNFKDTEATKRTEVISNNAQWFEDNAPIDKRFKKKKVKGVSAKVITMCQLGGDCYPSTPIGINLPNADWIRKEYGSKSVTIENITYAYDKASQGSGALKEFCFSDEEVELAKKYGYMASNLHTDLHECLGHGSGQLLEGTSPDALKNYSAVLEEARADLFALYYIADPKLIELGLLPNTDAAKAEYNAYLRNGLITQLVRIEKGKDIEEAHMRNRQLIAKWCMEKGQKEKIIEMPVLNGKTYVKINDYQKLRDLFAKLLAEIQRIKSEGDYEAGKKLVETYAVKVDSTLHSEILKRYKKLNIAPYGGFINPVFKPIENNGNITDIKVEYPDNFTEQMLWYSDEFSFLPDYN